MLERRTDALAEVRVKGLNEEKPTDVVRDKRQGQTINDMDRQEAPPRWCFFVWYSR